MKEAINVEIKITAKSIGKIMIGHEKELVIMLNKNRNLYRNNIAGEWNGYINHPSLISYGILGSTPRLSNLIHNSIYFPDVICEELFWKNYFQN